MRVREIWVEWLNENRARSLFLQRRAKAMAKGERVSPEETDSICDWVEDSECLESRKFPTLGLAKGWARRNVGLDMFENPRIHVNEFDDRDPWDYETILSLEWQEVEWVVTDGVANAA